MLVAAGRALFRWPDRLNVEARLLFGCLEAWRLVLSVHSRSILSRR